jgi:hypothetical protein
MQAPLAGLLQAGWIFDYHRCIANWEETPMSTFHDLEMESITGESVQLSKYQDNLCLIVNVASR